MRRLLVGTLIVFAASIGMLTPSPVDAQPRAQAPRTDRPVLQRRVPDAARRGATAFVRTELFFGTAKSDGTAVSDDEFKAFVDNVITRRFPDGLTVVKADGQFKASDGTIVKEQSYVVTLLYAAEAQKDGSRKIEIIRRIYMNLHDQDSVLRVDDPFFVWASF
jgi:hypothetical protein